MPRSRRNLRQGVVPFRARPGRSGLAVGVLALLGPAGPAEGPAGAPGTDASRAPPGKDGVPTPVRLLDDKVGRWLPENRTRLNELHHHPGHRQPHVRPDEPPRGRVRLGQHRHEERHRRRHLLLDAQARQDPPAAGQGLGTTSAPPHRRGAATALNAACDAAAAPGEPLPTSTDTALRRRDRQHLQRRQDRGRARPPGRLAPPPTMNTAYAWVAQLLAGYTPDEVARLRPSAAYAENARRARRAPRRRSAPSDRPQRLAAHLRAD